MKFVTILALTGIIAASPVPKIPLAKGAGKDGIPKAYVYHSHHGGKNPFAKHHESFNIMGKNWDNTLLHPDCDYEAGECKYDQKASGLRYLLAQCTNGKKKIKYFDFMDKSKYQQHDGIHYDFWIEGQVKVWDWECVDAAIHMAGGPEPSQILHKDKRDKNL